MNNEDVPDADDRLQGNDNSDLEHEVSQFFDSPPEYSKWHEDEEPSLRNTREQNIQYGAWMVHAEAFLFNLYIGHAKAIGNPLDPDLEQTVIKMNVGLGMAVAGITHIGTPAKEGEHIPFKKLKELPLALVKGGSLTLGVQYAGQLTGYIIGKL